jgi:hypothetical protein
MDMSKREFDWSAVTLWVVATILAWAIQWAPFPGGNPMLSQVASSTGYDPVAWQIYACSGFLIGTIGGIALGIIQWFILREVISGATLWAILTVGGMMIGQGAGYLLSKIWIVWFRTAHDLGVGQELAYPEAVQMVTQSAALQYLPVGLALGLLQWAVLRRSRQAAWLWAVTSLTVWPISGAMYWIVYGVLGGPFCQSWSCLFDPPGPGYYPASIVGWLAGGLVAGVITAVIIRSFVSIGTGLGEQGATNQTSIQGTSQK